MWIVALATFLHDSEQWSCWKSSTPLLMDRPFFLWGVCSFSDQPSVQPCWWKCVHTSSSYDPSSHAEGGEGTL